MEKNTVPPQSGPFNVGAIDFISVMNHIDEGVIITDHEGIIHFYNDTQAEIDGLDPEFVAGKRVTDIYQLCGDTSLIMLCLKTGKPIRSKTFFYKTIFGKVANAIVSTFPIFKNSQVTGTICFVKDYKILKNTTPVISVPEYKPKRSNGTRYTFADIIGNNSNLMRSVNTARTAADSASPIILIGETGTGKELFAQSIHNQSRRCNHPYVAVNCAAIPESLLEGMLFGTTKGAFTGAMDKPGLLEQANNSTLFLDELLSMPVNLQAKLLRVIQERKVQRLGSVEEINLNIKIISSVSRPPREAIVDKELRTDLFYRIGVVMVKIPPLRERLDDLADLIHHFILTLNNTLGTNVQSLSPDVMSMFQSYQWPGNIRELEHLLEGALNIVGFDEELSLKHFSPAFDTMVPREHYQGLSNIQPSAGRCQEEGTSIDNRSLLANQTEQEFAALRNALLNTHGNVSKSSTILGISRQLLHYKMKKHGLRRESFLKC